jgi:hypothetical protein
VRSPPSSSSLLILVSTPWQLFCALGLLFGPYRHARRTLALIDQRSGRRDPWHDVLDQLNEPGLQIRTLPAIGKSPLAKLRNTRGVLRQVSALVDEVQPDEIIGGNDRRVEFQYAMAHASRRRYTLGAYLDDGTFSYSGLNNLRKRRHDSLLTQLEKLSGRLHYGNWYDKPAALGTSRWVEYAWLAFPEHAHALLASKPRLALDPYWYRRSEVLALCQRLTEGNTSTSAPAAFDRLLLLPHDHLLRADAGLRAALTQQLDDARRNGEQIAIKRHPRSESWLLDVDRSGLVELDSRLPIEAYAPWLAHAKIAGTLSTALLSLRWLCPDARIEALSHAGALADPLQPLYRRLGIRVGETEPLDRPLPTQVQVHAKAAANETWLLVG